jgi:GTP cyclohydrolase II
MNSAKLRIGVGHGRRKTIGGIPFLATFPQIGYIFIFPFAGFQENGVLTWRERAFYSRYSIHVPCKINRCNIGFKCAELRRSMKENLESNRATTEFTVKKEAEANLPTEFGHFRIVGFRSSTSDEEFVALVKGEISPDHATLVRIHSQCLTGDVFHSLKCDCGPQLERAMKMVQSEGSGIIVYQHQEGRGIGITNKIRAYALQDEGADTIEANLRLGFDIDHRRYDQCAEVIKLLGATRVRLMSNNPDKVRALHDAGLDVVERVPLEIKPKAPAVKYLIVKKEKMGHLLQLNGIF